MVGGAGNVQGLLSTQSLKALLESPADFTTFQLSGHPL